MPWSNARQGGKKLRLRHVEQEDEGGQVHIIVEISDNGPGIPVHLREKVFEPFYTTRADGTGLGLAIVRQTVHEHQGTIEIDSSESAGSRFTIQLPLP